MPLIQTKGAASAQGFGEFARTAANYIEDVFQTWLYTGTGASQTITNGVDLSGNGGLVWIKDRTAASSQRWYDTLRGTDNAIFSNLTNAQTNTANTLTAFNSNGFTVGSANSTNGNTYTSWTFRKQPKFFDVVTYTGNAGGVSRTIAHNLGSVPGCIIVKPVSGVGGDWYVYHRSLGATQLVQLNTTGAAFAFGSWDNTEPTATNFTVKTNLNDTGVTYVAYLFAHDAGGFGASGTDNVISCGSFSGGGTTVNLGWEPQWILAKRTDTSGDWYIDDNMRGWPAAGANDNPLLANTSAAEPTGYAGFANITSTGFTNNFNGTYIYIAIRRGPMRTPTTGTSVFVPVTQTLATGSFVNTGFVTDMGLSKALSTADPILESRLTKAYLRTNTTGAESSGSSTWDYMNGYGPTPWSGAGLSSVAYGFRRAPGFFDVVCYTGTGATQTINHNLRVAPELMIWKRRSATSEWIVGTQFGASTFLLLYLNSTAAENIPPYTYAGSGQLTAAPTSTSWGVTGTSPEANASGSTYVTYLFATVAGVSKVFSYTGNGSSQTINCGFTGGARFVLIKRTDSTGDWYVWDSARGIVAANDPHLSLNSTAAEVTTDDSVDTDSTGFVVNQVAATNVNVTSATYIGLAIA